MKNRIIIALAFLFAAATYTELAGNSDQYPLAEKGVPSILFENESGDAFPYYHTPYDTCENAIFVSYEPIFRLVRDFVERY